MHLPIPNVVEVMLSHERLNGLTILHLSDLHLNKKTTLFDVQKLVALCQTLTYDFAVITGDIIDTKAANIKQQLRCLNHLERVYYISGNHDLVYGLEALKKELPHFTFIDNQSVTIAYKNETLLLAGLSDRFSPFFKIKREIQRIKEALSHHPNSILLAHQPKDYIHAVQSNTDLFLCGHTHGGQIFPFHYLVRLVQPFLNGLFYRKKSAIYVNKGLGTWGIDYRFKAESEITLLKLTSKSVQYSKGEA